MTQQASIYLPQPLLRRIDKAAKEARRSRSSYIRVALEKATQDTPISNERTESVPREEQEA
jgi:metal-responsive CopG/Arc/MetJ family transcriptional regulator